MRWLSFDQWVLLFVVVVGVVSTSVIAVTTLHNSQEGALARSALCTLQADLVQRVKSGDDFLAKHPNGAFGLTAAQIKVSIDGQKRTIEALAPLQCSTKG